MSGAGEHHGRAPWRLAALLLIGRPGPARARGSPTGDPLSASGSGRLGGQDPTNRGRSSHVLGFLLSPPFFFRKPNSLSRRERESGCSRGGGHGGGGSHGGGAGLRGGAPRRGGHKEVRPLLSSSPFFVRSCPPPHGSGLIPRPYYICPPFCFARVLVSAEWSSSL